MPKPARDLTEAEPEKTSLGVSPAALAKRDLVKPNPWCPKPNLEFDPWCDEDNPKTVTYKDVEEAASTMQMALRETPLIRSKWCTKFCMELYYKCEFLNRTGSFNERGAVNALYNLTKDQKEAGVITASLGNWARALAYYGQKLTVPVTVVLPSNTPAATVEKCQEYAATVVLHGMNFAEAKRQAFAIVSEKGQFYINGSDHPNVISASGTIGLEILKQLPQTDVILVPIGGGGLIAGIATAVKQLKPEVLIYGVESDKCCCFFKAMENERPYQTAVVQCLAGSLAVPTAGPNAFHTARSLIDKMVLVDDDRIARAMLHLVEEERFVVEGAGATSLSALLSEPDILPELRKKTVVCLLTGGNIDLITLPLCIQRAKTAEGRIIKLIVTLSDDQLSGKKMHVLSMISNVNCNIRQCYSERAWISEDEMFVDHLTLICEVADLQHACHLRRVVERLCPGLCEFEEDPFRPIPICACFPKKRF